ncbi:hypothetical protein HDU92_005271 [Lobulomyces angularis]|nr:hypothetical protein HDU92_005271 [Lobulomyces angularis]
MANQNKLNKGKLQILNNENSVTRNLENESRNKNVANLKLKTKNIFPYEFSCPSYPVSASEEVVSVNGYYTSNRSFSVVIEDSPFFIEPMINNKITLDKQTKFISRSIFTEGGIEIPCVKESISTSTQTEENCENISNPVNEHISEVNTSSFDIFDTSEKDNFDHEQKYLLLPPISQLRKPLKLPIRTVISAPLHCQKPSEENNSILCYRNNFNEKEIVKYNKFVDITPSENCDTENKSEHKDYLFNFTFSRPISCQNIQVAPIKDKTNVRKINELNHFDKGNGMDESDTEFVNLYKTENSTFSLIESEDSVESDLISDNLFSIVNLSSENSVTEVGLIKTECDENIKIGDWDFRTEIEASLDLGKSFSSTINEITETGYLSVDEPYEISNSKNCHEEIAVIPPYEELENSSHKSSYREDFKKVDSKYFSGDRKSLLTEDRKNGDGPKFDVSFDCINHFQEHCQDSVPAETYESEDFARKDLDYSIYCPTSELSRPWSITFPPEDCSLYYRTKLSMGYDYSDDRFMSEFFK